MSEQNTMSRSQAIQAVLDRLDKPITWDDFVQQVLVLAPSQAKKPAAGIRSDLRYDGAQRVVLLDKKTLIPTRLVMKGLRFRITLTRQDAKHGIVAVFPWFAPFMQMHPMLSDNEFNPHFYDEQGQTISSKPASLRQQVASLWGGRDTIQSPAVNLSGWLAKHNAQRDDSLLVTIKDWLQQEYILAFEPVKRIDKTKVRQQNAALAYAIYEMVCNHDDDRPFSTEIIPYAYAQLGDAARDYPGDHWTTVVDNDKRLGRIGYINVALARYVSFDDKPRLQEADRESLNKVFRFKACFKHRKSIWRRIELRGSDRLFDFDSIMRDAFNHDTWDHLSEFYYKPKDRKGRNARWEGYGSHEPGGGGEAQDIQIAQMELGVGDVLQYVYDFGDWVEHTVELEAITNAKPGVKYPRIAEQNKPRFRRCESCAEKGKKEQATWICIECSNEQQRDVLLCEQCLLDEHADHYSEEIVY